MSGVKRNSDRIAKNGSDVSVSNISKNKLNYDEISLKYGKEAINARELAIYLSRARGM